MEPTKGVASMRQEEAIASSCFRRQGRAGQGLPRLEITSGYALGAYRKSKAICVALFDSQYNYVGRHDGQNWL